MDKNDTCTMSDSEDAAQLPSKSRIEQALRQAVAAIFKSGKHEDLTMKRVRSMAEAELDLPDDFFKSSAKWKDRSKEIVSNEVVCSRVPNCSTVYSLFTTCTRHWWL